MNNQKWRKWRVGKMGTQKCTIYNKGKWKCVVVAVISARGQLVWVCIVWTWCAYWCGGCPAPVISSLPAADWHSWLTQTVPLPSTRNNSSIIPTHIHTYTHTRTCNSSFDWYCSCSIAFLSSPISLLFPSLPSLSSPSNAFKRHTSCLRDVTCWLIPAGGHRLVNVRWSPWQRIHTLLKNLFIPVPLLSAVSVWNIFFVCCRLVFSLLKAATATFCWWYSSSITSCSFNTVSTWWDNIQERSPLVIKTLVPQGTYHYTTYWVGYVHVLNVAVRIVVIWIQYLYGRHHYLYMGYHLTCIWVTT